MRHLLPILILTLLFSCSDAKKAQYHYKKALKYGLELVQDSDTIRIISVDSIPVVVNDTIIWEKIITTKDTIISFKNVYVPKTRYQTRIEYKYKTQILKQDVLKYKYIYKDAKKQKAKTNWMLLVWGFIIGVLLSFVTRLLLKLYL
jgi:RsiW-degrading membrane proteinase PrsW (M82 family)